MASTNRKEMLEKIRAKMKARSGGKRPKDPDEFRAPRVEKGHTFKVKAYVLPPLNRGEKCATGVAEHGMDDLFYLPVGMHWINNRYYPCPRVFDGDNCPYCQLGFDLMRETDDREARSEIGRAYLPRSQYCVNLYFPPLKTNPENLRGTVKYYSLPKTIFDRLDECIQRDDDGGDELDPKPFGLFYDPNDSYVLQIEITRKGEYNNYENTKFLPSSRGPIAKSEEEIEKILNMRHDLPAKFSERDPAALQRLVDRDTGDGGFDADENNPSGNFEQSKSKNEVLMADKSSDQDSADSADADSADSADADSADSGKSDSEFVDEELARMLDEMKQS